MFLQTRHIVGSVIIAGFLNCTTPYNPPAIKGNNQFLVVDGIIRNGSDSTIFTLSRSANLGDSSGPQPELQAQVEVVGQSSGAFPLANLGNGRYGIDQLNLDAGQNYQLRIVASNGEQYASDFVPVRESPPIDSLHWQEDSIGVSIYVNTHDPLNNTRFYQWDFTQTWEHRVFYYSDLILQPDGSTILRPQDQQIYRCWSSTNSNNILVTTTSGLAADVVYMFPLTTIPNGSEQISFTYSILVRQYAITSEAFQYWQDLKQNTELTGSIFQPQPSSLTGNLHCLSNPNEPVMGFISASTESSLRLFIAQDQLSSWNYIAPTSTTCPYWIPDPDSLAYYSTFPSVFQPFSVCNPFCHVALASVPCIDCLYWGGTNVAPSYWPN